ncbi:MAG: 50S ribosome-binding GTPase [Desulfobacterales bacterium]|nr:50S ribosome-binding GTPase [Desulfobacterales bacterium]
MLEKLVQAIVHPKVNDSDMDDVLYKIQQNLPIPVFWLLGKAQSGKTSIIRALTQNTRAEIGDGIRPCTRTAYVYDFPNQYNCFLKFLDTRGLGETDYDPTDDLAQYQSQSHLLIVVMKAMDLAQNSVLSAVRHIVSQRPDWPIIVAQTCLHEGYPDVDINHILPYPYNKSDWNKWVPIELARSIMYQRKLFQGMNVTFVPVDLTLLDDGYEPVNYGINTLWEAIETALPSGMISIVRQSIHIQNQLSDLYTKTAHNHIIGYAMASAAGGAIPIPFVDIPVVTVIQAKMLHTIASIYNLSIDKRCIHEIGGALGVGFITNILRRELLKFIPVFGTAVSSALTAATTYALGKTFVAYFSYINKGGVPDAEIFRELYQDKFQEGKALLSNYAQLLKEHPSYEESQNA